ncbi:lipid-A-disaccharide synthase [Lacipirellula parvula]|uniref:Lipid-A-disaccharide synthase n=1 Tax=Lacipirellula parvula TaxID=2650471 RepID=A0A5K7XJZ3_9BACT|nr:lipid-A-disaccharide synthase [Lacipirellula parvula]BBO35431.1 lipid-A-disaccharide synthase [Lacipirellula parvula]
MKIFFSVGEPSGDLHGANLIRAFQRRHSDWEYVGYGGPRMAAAGCKLHADLTQLAVMWIARVLVNLHKFIGLLIQADRYFRDERPDAVVMIDYPGFNWWIARRAKARGIPVIYYGTPQVWAWASHRVKKMQRFVDHVLCKLPFEEPWFRERGCNATYVGHPYFDELRNRTLDEQFVAELAKDARPLVTILPGSRTQEVELNTQSFLKAARLIAEQVPDARFAVAAFKESQAETIRKFVAEAGVKAEVYVGRTPELIHSAACCLACSGSVSLELLYHAKPSVILYQISRFGFIVQERYRRVRYITLVNLLTAKEIATPRPAHLYDANDPADARALLPEYLTRTDKSAQLAAHCVEWLTDADARWRRVAALRLLRDQHAGGGASERAADYITNVLASHDSGSVTAGKIPPPHMLQRGATQQRKASPLNTAI